MKELENDLKISKNDYENLKKT